MGQTTITKKCTKCGDCVSVCPTDSIFFGYEQYVIDSDTCHDCQICIPICPDVAIISPVKLEPEVYDDQDVNGDRDEDVDENVEVDDDEDNDDDDEEEDDED